MPPSATGSEATLNDIIAWPRAIAIIGTQDCRASALPTVPAAVVMISLPSILSLDASGPRLLGLFVIPQAARRTDPFQVVATGISRRAVPSRYCRLRRAAAR